MPKGIFKNPIERARKISQALKGHPIYKSKERSKKLSKAFKGRISTFKGKKHTEEAKQKNRLKHLGKKPTLRQLKALKLGQGWNKGKLYYQIIGSKNPAWKGGISFEPYSTDWTETLRRSIRERDHYICQLCNGYGNIVHHIDEDKKNCNHDNLITLCRKCHTKLHRKKI